MTDTTYAGLLHKYGHLLDLPSHTRTVSLLEGNTPLIHADNLSRQLGGGFELFIKYEGLNPTGSFKDRGMTAAVSEALGRGATTVICASTGNTAASAAAYAARAGMKSIVLIPQGKVAAGKLAGAVAYGAQVIQIDGSFDDALTMVVDITNKHPICLVNSINPYRIEGQKTAAFEICDALGSAPDWLCLPVGNAGNITSYWTGFKQYNELKSTGVPQILGVQAAGAAPLVVGHPVENPETVATAIRIGKPARGEQALQAAEESRGRIIAVTDEQILSMQKMLAKLEGIWVEPASAAGLAGLAHEVESGKLKVEGKRVVVICTGHGLKDPDIITKDMHKPMIVPPRLDALEEVILGMNRPSPLSPLPFRERGIIIRVPATSANLGPGFDSLGLALDLWNEVTVTPADDFLVRVRGEGADRLALNRNNLIVHAARKLAEHAGRSLPPFHAECVNAIPLSSGMGSSSAAILTGLLAGNTLLGNPLLKEEILNLASEMEGHPDNVAPALLGGLVVSTMHAGRVLAHPIPMGLEVRITIVLPDFHLPTRQARAALPKRILLRDAVHNISRAVMVAEALRLGDLELLGKVMTDALHQPYRLKLIPGAEAAMEAAREAGAAAVALSGAGPSLIAFSKTGADIGESMRRAFEAVRLQARIFNLRVSGLGARIQMV